MHHKDPKPTSNVYTDVQVSDMQAAAKALAAVAPKVVPKVVPTRGSSVHVQSTDVNSNQVEERFEGWT